MKRIAAMVFLLAAWGFAQESKTPPDSGTTFRVDVVSRSTRAVNYRHRGGATSIDFKGTALSPASKGKAKVESKQGYIEIDASFEGLTPAYRQGPEYLTYVLWAITPEGRPKNLGELLLNGSKSKLNVTTDLQVFGLVITAEPYFAVTQPSDVIIMENELRPDTRGKWEIVDAKFELLQKGQYAGSGSAQPPTWSPKIPVELIEARNALRIARMNGAEKYAADTFEKAKKALDQAEDYQDRQAGAKPIAMMARESVQRSEDARMIALKRQDEERLEAERLAAADREASAKAAAEAEAKRRQQAELDRAAAEKARQEAEQAARRASEERAAADRSRLEAEKARLEAEKARREADAARLQAEAATRQAEAAKAAALDQQQQLAAEAEKARLAAAESDRLRRKAEQEKSALRQQLRDQLNAVLETRDSARGLILNMSDVLFDVGRYTLKPDARERLARVSGIVLAHPSLHLNVEGHTDSVGGDDYNQKLSENRANAVVDFLGKQGLPEDRLSAVGFGEMQPIAPNETAAGRKQNRRVEIVVSGEAIGQASAAP